MHCGIGCTISGTLVLHVGAGTSGSYNLTRLCIVSVKYGTPLERVRCRIVTFLTIQWQCTILGTVKRFNTAKGGERKKCREKARRKNENTVEETVKVRENIVIKGRRQTD